MQGLQEMQVKTVFELICAKHTVSLSNFKANIICFNIFFNKLKKYIFGQEIVIIAKSTQDSTGPNLGQTDRVVSEKKSGSAQVVE